MKNFDLKKYLAEGKLLKESTLEYLIDKYGQKMIDFTIKVDQLKGGEVNDIEYLEDRIKTHLEEPAIRQKYLAEGKLISESTPGYDTRKFGESLPTMESIKAAYEAKNDIEEKNDYANSEEDFTDRMVIEKIFDIIRYHELDPSDMLEEIGQEFGIDFEFGAGNGRGSQEQEARIKAMQRGLGHS